MICIAETFGGCGCCGFPVRSETTDAADGVCSFAGGGTSGRAINGESASSVVFVAWNGGRLQSLCGNVCIEWTLGLGL